MTPAELTRDWIERAVLQRQLCPFAARVLARGAVSIRTSPAREFDRAVDDLLDAAAELAGAPPSPDHTELVIFPDALADFADLLDAVAALEDALERTGCDRLLQLAHFHPRYLFEGDDPGDPAHYTNRAPYPTVQLLQVADVFRALEAFGDPDAIWQRNVEALRAEGADAVRRAWSAWLDPF